MNAALYGHRDLAMSKIWSEPYDSMRHRNPMGWEIGGEPAPSKRDLRRARTLDQYPVLFVRVCSFTFEFHTVEQLRACRDFYATKVHPSSRSRAAAQAVAKGSVTWRWEVERWFERLPLYLREESKRIEVVAALEDALQQVESGKLQLSSS